MSAIPISVHEISSEDQKCSASNLLNDEGGSWKCACWQKNSWITFKVDQPYLIERIELMNASSAFIEIFVSNSAQDNYQVLVPTFSAMSPNNSKTKTACKGKFVFKMKHFSPFAKTQSWKYIKLICSQPFNKTIKFGLSSIRVCGSQGESNLTEKKCGSFGSFKRKASVNYLYHNIFGTHDLTYKKSLSERIEETLPLKLRIMDETEDEQIEKPQEKQKNGKRSQEDDGSRKKKKRVKEKNIPVKADPAVTGSSSGDNDSLAFEPSNWQLQQPSTSKETVQADFVSKTAEKKAQAFGSLMSHVVFVLSGYENPQRSELREKATEMGARYSAKWDSNCTHLICAFPNTPKFSQVLGLNGRIVSKKWILNSYAQRRLLGWRKFMMGTYAGPDTPPQSEEEDGEGRERDEDGASKGKSKALADASVAVNDKRRAERSTTRTANGYDSDVIYDLDTASEDDD